MEEVWVVYLCLILLMIVVFLMKHNPHVEEAKKERESKSPPPASSFVPSNVGKKLEYTQEELENYLDRLTHVLFDSDARKRGDHHEQKSHHHHHRRTDAPFEPSAEEAARSQHLSSHTRVQHVGVLCGLAVQELIEECAENKSTTKPCHYVPEFLCPVGQKCFFLEPDEVGPTFQDLGADDKEKTTPPGSTENIVEEIEQAVQETVDTDVYGRRRQRSTASRRYRESYRPERAVEPETDAT